MHRTGLHQILIFKIGIAMGADERPYLLFFRSLSVAIAMVKSSLFQQYGQIPNSTSYEKMNKRNTEINTKL